MEEALKTRARAIPIEVGPKETLNPLIIKLKNSSIGILTEFEAKNLEAIAKMRNDAAHGGEFDYTKKEIQNSLQLVEITINKFLGNS